MSATDADEKTISIRQLGKHISAMIAEVEQTGEPLLITRDGLPVARLVPLLEGWPQPSRGSVPLEGG